MNFLCWFMHQSIPSTNIPPPPGRPLGFCTLLLPLMTLPGGRFLHIHKITFSTVKSILSLSWHLDHTSMRFIGSSDFAKAFQDTRHKLLTAKERCGMKISYLQKINRACLYSYLIRYQIIIRHIAFTKPFVPVFNHYIYRIYYPSLS